MIAIVPGVPDPVTPMPLALTACGLPVPVLTTVIVAFWVPVAPGVNVKLNEQPAPAPTVAHVEFVTANSDGLLLLTADTVTAAPPMLVTVTERTREIGLRMAIGARGRDVLLQFLVEAVVLSLFGGAIGIALGFGLSQGVTFWMSWPTAVSPGAVAVSFGFAGAIGVFFGFYPARKAAALDPIDALRFE